MISIITLLIHLSLHFSPRDSLKLIGMIKIKERREEFEYIHKGRINLYFPDIDKSVYSDIKGVYFFKIPGNITYLRAPEVRYKDIYFSFFYGGIFMSMPIEPEYGFAISSSDIIVTENYLTVDLSIDYDTLLKWVEEEYEGRGRDTLLALVKAYKIIERIDLKMDIDTIISIYSKSINIIPTFKAINRVLSVLEEKMDTNGLRDTLLFRNICDKIFREFLAKSKGKYMITHKMIIGVLMEHSNFPVILKSLEGEIKEIFKKDTLLYHLYLINIAQSKWVSAESLAFEMVKNYPEFREYFSLYYYTLFPEIYIHNPKFSSNKGIVNEAFTVYLESDGVAKYTENIFKKLNLVFSHINNLEKLAESRDTFDLIKAHLYLSDKKNLSKGRKICRYLFKKHPFWFLNIYLLFWYAKVFDDYKETESLADYVYKNRDKFELSCDDILSLIRILEWSDLSWISLNAVKKLYNFALYHLRNRQPGGLVAWRCRQEKIYKKWDYVMVRAYSKKMSALIEKKKIKEAEKLLNEIFEKFPCHDNQDLWFTYARFNRGDREKLLNIYSRGFSCGVYEFYDSLIVLVEKMYNKEEAKKILYEVATSNKSAYALRHLKEWLKNNNMDYSEVEEELKKFLAPSNKIR